MSGKTPAHLSPKAVPAARTMFGARVRRERERRGWSLEVMGSRSGLSRSTVHRAENGREIVLGAALAIAAAFGVPLGDLLREPECRNCDGFPPPGFGCPDCGTVGGT